MSEAQFDEVFQKLEKVIKEIITKREYESITGQKFYDKFKVEFGILSSPALRAGIKLQKQTLFFNGSIKMLVVPLDLLASVLLLQLVSNFIIIMS